MGFVPFSPFSRSFDVRASGLTGAELTCPRFPWVLPEKSDLSPFAWLFPPLLLGFFCLFARLLGPGASSPPEPGARRANDYGD